jgi:hypothetical protein
MDTVALYYRSVLFPWLALAFLALVIRIATVMPAKGADVPESAKIAARTKYLKKANKRRTTRDAKNKIHTERYKKPKPLKKAKKIK